jgi:NADH:ubiquinone oxidoreductase subunit H
MIETIIKLFLHKILNVCFFIYTEIIEMLFNYFSIKSLILIILSVILIIVPILLTVALLTLLERKTMAILQRRRGPNIVGFFGILQPFADGLKLLTKEFNIPARSFDTIVTFAPMMSLIFTCSCFSLISFASSYLFYTTNNISILYIMAISSLNIYSIIMAGWSSKSTYAFLGSLRASAQFISYEVSLTLNIMGILLISGSFNLIEISYMQEKSIPNIFIIFPIFLLYLIGILSETNRTPYDLAEAESELVAGYGVEFSAVGFAFFFIAEYASIILYCLLIINLFFSGISSLDFLIKIYNIIKDSLFYILKIYIKNKELKDILTIFENYSNINTSINSIDSIKQTENKNNFPLIDNLSEEEEINFIYYLNEMGESLYLIKITYIVLTLKIFLQEIYTNIIQGIFIIQTIIDMIFLNNISISDKIFDYYYDCYDNLNFLRIYRDSIIEEELKIYVSFVTKIDKFIHSKLLLDEETYEGKKEGKKDPWYQYFYFFLSGVHTIENIFDIILIIIKRELIDPFIRFKIGGIIELIFFNAEKLDGYYFFLEHNMKQSKNSNNYFLFEESLRRCGEHFIYFNNYYKETNFHILKFFIESFIFSLLTLFFLYFLIHIRATYARYRFDQLMKLNWKNLLILSLIFDIYICIIIINF